MLIRVRWSRISASSIVAMALMCFSTTAGVSLSWVACSTVTMPSFVSDMRVLAVNLPAFFFEAARSQPRQRRALAGGAGTRWSEPLALEHPAFARRGPLLVLAVDRVLGHSRFIAVDRGLGHVLREQKLALVPARVAADWRHASALGLKPHRQHQPHIRQLELVDQTGRVLDVDALLHHHNG
jgi:hypothetical protein